MHTAFENLCKLSSNAVFVVVPFIQGVHGPKDGDFWRFTPDCLKKLFVLNGLTVILQQAGPSRGAVKYVAMLGVRDPEKHVLSSSCLSTESLQILNERYGYTNI